MATGSCEALERNEECPDSVKGLSVQKESIQQQLKEDRKEDAKIPTNKEEVNGTPNGIEKKGKDQLHIIEKDLDEFVDSMTEVMPEELPDAEKHLGAERVPEKLPRAEQVAEKVLRAEKVAERAPQVEKLPGTEKGAEKSPHVEKVAEKAPRAEKVPEKAPRAEKAVEKTPRAEKPAEKTRPAGSPGWGGTTRVPNVCWEVQGKNTTAPKAVPKRRAAASPAKDTLPWEGLTLNKCILVACVLGLLSVSCQVVQDFLDFGDDVPVTEPGSLIPPESSPEEGGLAGEIEELWFYERWLRWPEDYEPPEPEEEEEEELEPVEIEEEEEEPTEIEEEEEPTEEEEEPTEEEEEAEEPVTKAEPRKSREKIRGEAKTGRREKSFKDKAPKDRKAHKEEKKEEKRPSGKHHRRESSEKEQRKHHWEEGKGRPPKHELAHFKEHKRHPQDEGKGRHKEERGGRSEGRHPRQEQDSKHHPHEFKGRKPWHVQRPFFSQKDSGHKSGKHKFQEGKRHD
ncbi:UNVERIFIED_CONTAM: hypothetical protein K2H54_018381 [Gekko kuhli]